MHTINFSKTLLLKLSLILLTYLTHSTQGTAVSTTSDVIPTVATSEDVATSGAVVTSGTVGPKLADICNTSLITTMEDDEDAVPVKCTCSVTNVYCNYLGITELQKLISFPKEVQIASFKGNKITTLNQDTFYNGRGLTELDLSYNRIDFVSSKTFMAFKNLRKLDLSHNRIWNLPTTAFHELSSLIDLNLGYNDLINVFPDLFGSLVELRHLVLENNPLEELEPKHFEHLQKLEQLNLESTLLRLIPDHIFIFTPKLKILNLAGNLLTTVPTQALHVLDRLKVLSLKANPIEVIHAEAFRGMTGLIILYLDNMPHLMKIENYAFGDMIHLEELHCSYNFKLTEIEDNAFIRKVDNTKVQLHQLFLRQNQLTSVPKSLLDWNDGLEVHLRENPLHCDCKADWMINIKLKNNFQTHLKCASPDDYENMALVELKGQQLTCGLQLSEIVMIACAVITAFLILLMIVAFLMWRRNYTGYRKPRYQVSKKKYVNDVVYCGTEDDI